MWNSAYRARVAKNRRTNFILMQQPRVLPRNRHCAFNMSCRSSVSLSESKAMNRPCLHAQRSLQTCTNGNEQHVSSLVLQKATRVQGLRPASRLTRRSLRSICNACSRNLMRLCLAHIYFRM